MVLDLGLKDMNGFELLETVKANPSMWDLPIIIYTGKDLSPAEDTKLRKFAETIIVKDVKSPERLLDETALFLHRVEAKLPEQKRRMLERLHNTDAGVHRQACPRRGRRRPQHLLVDEHARGSWHAGVVR
jgi:CheY-like chemotaxis protein